LLFLSTKHTLNALLYKDLVLAEVEPPIVVIAPDFTHLEDTYRQALQFAGEADLLSHSRKLFGRNFANVEELTAFLVDLSSPAELVARVSDPSRLLFDTEWAGPLEQQIKRYGEEIAGRLGPGLGTDSAGRTIQLALIGRMMQANDVVFKASRLRGNPIIDAPTSWQYLLWKYEYDGRLPENLSPSIRDLLITKVISVEGSAKIGLLTSVPPEVLIELRRSGAMAELREVMRKGVEDVDAASPASLAEVGETVVTNLSHAFAKHRKELEEFHSTQRKFFGFDVGRWIAFGGISIGAASGGSPSLAVLAASLGMIGAPRIDELWTRWKEIQSQGDTLRRSPTGILFRHLLG
jgi:hypothetical protein